MALDLGKEIGPLPLGAWVVVVAGGLGIAYYSKTHASTSADPAIDTSGQAGVGDGTVGGWIPTSPDTSASGNAAGASAPTTNDEWAYQAKQFLIGKGYPATTVQSAIDKYVNGITPSIQEYTLVGIALAAIGPLPQTLPTGPVEPTTPIDSGGTQTPAAGSTRGYGWYLVSKGDTASSIAKKAGITVITFYAYNGGKALKAGQWVKIRAASNPVFGYGGR